jgi:hypothetical protein
MMYEVTTFCFKCDKCSKREVVHIASDQEIKLPKGWKTKHYNNYCGDHYCTGHDKETHVCPKCSSKKIKTKS